MDHLYAPWRVKYFKEKSNECPFCLCAKANEQDYEKLGIIFKATNCFGVMNRYPYAPGHFMIIPNLHEEHIENLSEETWLEMSKLVRFGVSVLKASTGAKGVNIGMNLSIAAGAGIAAHCHYHLVPRFSGDTNFITTIGQTRVFPSDFKEIYDKIKLEFMKILKNKGI